MRQMVSDWLAEKTLWQRRIMKKQAGRARSFIILGYSMTLPCLANYYVLPYFGLAPRILNNITDLGLDRGRFFPSQGAFPFDVFSSPTFEVVYFFGCLGGIGSAIAATFPEFLFVTIVFHASGQYEIIGAEMQHLFDDITGYGAEDKIMFQAKIKCIVDGQVQLHRFCGATPASIVNMKRFMWRQLKSFLMMMTYALATLQINTDGRGQCQSLLQGSITSYLIKISKTLNHIPVKPGQFHDRLSVDLAIG
ncbi:hypothetical protein QAD02_000171 [Eretmocerus hayati]|uniref:Uncharacterized protein n=1 Tax=Eretmocerus hayati TaxID=131215 RepID=A0ACC2NCP3_9HYME|nr:hypothetical protein QAD02_000171 [Eretmocerus hayati]